jgi:RimJ/RimL family protein N-acetyltransferase
VTDRLETARLTLRRITMDDAPEMHAIFADEDAMRYWSRLPHTDLAETKAWVAKIIAANESGEGDDFVVICDGRLVGRIGIWQTNEVGLIFSPSVWGTGVAREAMASLIHHARDRRMASLMADIDPRNIRVRRFLGKFGFKTSGAAKNTYKIGDNWTDSEYLTLDLSENS